MRGISGVIPIESEAHRRIVACWAYKLLFWLFLVLRRLLLAGDALVDKAQCDAKFIASNLRRLLCMMRRRTASH